jgi:glycosyltransferase involved in cell wall biosynthesis
MCLCFLLYTGPHRGRIIGVKVVVPDSKPTPRGHALIRIAYVIDKIESPTAGTEKQLLALIQGLDRSSFSPVLCVLESTEWLETQFHACPAYEIGPLRSGDWRTLSRLLRFARFLRREGIHIVQTHFRDGNIVGILGAKLAGVKHTISTRRNQGYWHTTGELAILRLLNRWVTRFVANAESTAKQLIQTEGVPKDAVSIIPNGVDLGLFESIEPTMKHAYKERAGLPPDRPVVGIVANLRPVKAVDVFIHAAAVLSRKYTDALFVIVGDGSERADLEQLALRLGVSGHVRFFGSCPHVPALLPAFDLGVLTSHSESFSNALLEYMAAGLPVVCTDCGAARELLYDGAYGCIVPIGDPHAVADAVAKFVANGSASEAFVANRSRVFERYSELTMTRRHEALYVCIVGSFTP